MKNLSSTIEYTCLLFVLALGSESLKTTVECENIYPSEYAYHSDMHMMLNSERSSANCRRYASGLDSKPDAFTENYIHCDGTELRLTDSDYGSEQYSSSDYYVWPAGSSASQLLFIFPRRVNFTTITLHYYNDNDQGLPGLRFYAVPDDFDVWDAPLVSYSHVDVAAVVPPDGSQAGPRNVSINFNDATKKVLFYKHRNSYEFVVSEVEFCESTAGSVTEAVDTMTSYSGETAGSIMTTFLSRLPTSSRGASGNTSDTAITDPPHTTIGSTTKHLLTNSTAVNTNTELIILYPIIGVIIAILMLLLLTIITTISFIFLRRKVSKRKVYNNSSYSTLSREGIQQMQPQLLNTSNELYDQIQLSPSTGQAEFISKNETVNTNNPPQHQTEYDIHPSVDKDKPKSAKLKTVTWTKSTQRENKNTSEQPTYAVVNKKKKIKSHKESGHRQRQSTTTRTHDVMEKSVVERGYQVKESQDFFEAETKVALQTDESLQNLYSVVNKKPKERLVEDYNPPPIPPDTVEELYTSVKKVPKTNTSYDEDAAPQIPPHSIDELYTAVQKKPKANNSKDEEEAPPIPAHTVEELYTAVMKKPKVTTAEDEEKIPQVPPHIMDEL